MKKLTVFLLAALMGIMSACQKDNSSSSNPPNGGGPGTLSILMTADIEVYDEEDNLVEEIDYKGVASFVEEGLHDYVAQTYSGYTYAMITTRYHDLELGWEMNILFNNDSVPLAAGTYDVEDNIVMSLELNNYLESATAYVNVNQNDEEENTYTGELTITQFSNGYIKGTFSFVGYSINITTGVVKRVVVKNGKFEGKVRCALC